MKRNPAGRNRIGLLAAVMLPLILANGGASGSELDFASRVACTERIDRIYYTHRIGKRQPYDQSVMRERIESTVLDAIVQSLALRDHWGLHPTAEEVYLEFLRIHRDTLLPDRLGEIYAALDYDPLLILECLARPALTGRMVRRLFHHDQRIHDDRGAGGGAAEARSEVSWESWWSTQRELYGETALGLSLNYSQDHLSMVMSMISTPGSTSSHLQSPAVHAPSCDLWDETALEDVPDRRHAHTAVWTGSVMIIWGGRAGGNYKNSGGRYDPVTDTWSPTSRTNAPSPRSRHSAIWTGSEMIVWGGLSIQGGRTNTGGLYDPLTDQWTPTPVDNSTPAARADATAVWTGEEMIVWGGADANEQFGSGAAFDPETGSWRGLTGLQAPLGRQRHTAVWTGLEMIVWGGFNGFANDMQPLNIGGRYDPESDTWQPTSTVDAPSPRAWHTAVWTGSEMIVSGAGDIGGRYDPTTDTWLPTAALGAPASRILSTAVWTGTEMILWGGSSSTNPLDGGRYDPDTDMWTPIASVNEPEVRSEHSAVWTGTRMVVWGGSNGGDMNSGGQYDPIADSWATTSTGPGPAPRSSVAAGWTGSELIIWGGYDPATQTYLSTGAKYDPVLDIWTPTPTTNAPSPRAASTSAWTGQEFLVWGGTDGTFLVDGARYDPMLGVWTPMNSAGAPSARIHAVSVWTAEELFIWGGRPPSNEELDGGARYVVATDSWVPVSDVNAPQARTLAVGVWTGSHVLIWGGSAGGFLDTGSRYDPAADSWSPMSVTGAPSPRAHHTGVWTGTELLIWGGGLWVDDGARYDPVVDSWAPMSLSGRPSGRRFHTAVWTGEAMVVWGGDDGYDRRLDTGGRYYPSTDTWETVTTTGAPDPREAHIAVWTSQSMLVWGGLGADPNSTWFNSGGRYLFGNHDYDNDGMSICSGDCDDLNPSVFPGAPELCDNLDNDCDHAVDGFSITCGIGGCERMGSCFLGVMECTPGTPSAETCDGIDNDCDGALTPDEQDADADGELACAGDCDDENPAIHVGHPELCDNLDNNCDGVIDTFLTSCGVGECGSMGECLQGSDDCTPLPAEPEICDGLDNDCDGSVPAQELDADMDGVSACAGDCDPADGNTFPGAPEINDGIDNQCVGDVGYGTVDEMPGRLEFAPSNSSLLCWSAQQGALSYQIARAGLPDGTGCWTQEIVGTCWVDAELPGPGQASYLLVRSATPFVGSWGLDSNRQDRTSACGVERCDDGVDNDLDDRVDCADDDCTEVDQCAGTISFTFRDTQGDDIGTQSLHDFFQQSSLLPTDHLRFSIVGDFRSFEFCAERADLYRSQYLDLAEIGGSAPTGGWTVWYSNGSGEWTGPIVTSFQNYYGSQCFGPYSWCAEVGLGDRAVTVAPGDLSGCEARDAFLGCGDSSWILTISIGPSRLATCGF